MFMQDGIEFFFENEVYSFPKATRMVCIAGKTYFELGGKKIKNIQDFKISKPTLATVGLPFTKQGAEMVNFYKEIGEQLAKITYSANQFDHEIGRTISLCTFFKPEASIYEDGLVTQMTKMMPFFVNIFRRPLIHLREEYIIQDVEAVKRVDRETVKNLFRYPRHWKNVENGVIVPSRLITKIYDDDYCIYENRVFKYVVDKMSGFLATRLRTLSAAMMAFNSQVELDPLSGVTHVGYFLAIGKLYAGFASNPDAVGYLIELYKKSLAPYRTIQSNTNRHVYRLNKRSKPISGAVNKTNILTMHKDYKYVYKMWKLLNPPKSVARDELFKSQILAQQHYEKFCQALALFSANSFRFHGKLKDTVFKKGVVNAQQLFCGDWQLGLAFQNIAMLGINAVVLEVSNKKKRRRVLLVPMSYHLGGEKRKYYAYLVKKLISQKYKYDKYVFLEPFLYEDDTDQYGYSIQLEITKKTVVEYGVLPVSLTDINSFQRIQKIILECMIYTTQKKSPCAWCGMELSKMEGGRKCKKCHLVYEDYQCKNCKKAFLAVYPSRMIDKKRNLDYINTLPPFYRDEKLYMFRNLIELANEGVKCPRCKKCVDIF